MPSVREGHGTDAVGSAPAIADEDNTHLLPDRATGLPILRPHPARSALKKMRDVGLLPNLQQQADAGRWFATAWPARNAPACRRDGSGRAWG